VPEDADDTRGHHLGRLLRRPLTLTLGGIAVAVAFVAGLAAVGVLIGAAAAVGAILLTLLVVWLLEVFRKRQRVEHESDAVDKKFEIFTGENDDLNRARQVLSPTFLVWLDSHSPEAYAFELVRGSLVCNVKGHKKSAPELDFLCTASAAVARRLQEEATEPSGPAASGTL
jgi:hypothetical protein